MENHSKNKRIVTILHDIVKIFIFIYNSIGNLLHILGDIIQISIQYIRRAFQFGNQKIDEKIEYMKEINSEHLRRL